MEHRLERYLEQQETEYATYLESDNGTPITPMDESRYLIYEIRGIQKILATDDKYDLVTPAHWHERLRECRDRLKRLLIDEQASIQGVIQSHCEALILCNTRYLEIEAELKEVGVSL